MRYNLLRFTSSPPEGLQLRTLLVLLASGGGDSSFLLYMEPPPLGQIFPNLKRRGLLRYKILKLGTNFVFY